MDAEIKTGKIDPNDPDLDPDQVLCYLAMGSRDPQNDYERELLKSIKASEELCVTNGWVLDIPFD
jgi:hypothetical protein